MGGNLVFFQRCQFPLPSPRKMTGFDSPLRGEPWTMSKWRSPFMSAMSKPSRHWPEVGRPLPKETKRSRSLSAGSNPELAAPLSFSSAGRLLGRSFGGLGRRLPVDLEVVELRILLLHLEGDAVLGAHGLGVHPLGERLGHLVEEVLAALRVLEPLAVRGRVEELARGLLGG